MALCGKEETLMSFFIFKVGNTPGLFFVKDETPLNVYVTKGTALVLYVKEETPLGIYVKEGTPWFYM